MTPDEQHTIDEFERVLRAKRFATIHDLMNTGALQELADGSRATDWADHAPATELGQLPTRR